MPRILIVEDNADLQSVLKDTLHTHDSRGVGTVAEAKLELAGKRDFDLIILDVGLPDGNGYELCTAIRADSRNSEVPIIFLTGRGDLQDKIQAFSLGADDYLMKPFEPLELRARVDARLKRARDTGGRDPFVLQKGELKFDLSLQKILATEGDREVDLRLTPAEFKILYLLARNEGKCLSKDQLVRSIWGNDANVIDDNVYTHVSTLRKKLGGRNGCVESVPRLGYRFVSERTRHAT